MPVRSVGRHERKGTDWLYCEILLSAICTEYGWLRYLKNKTMKEKKRSWIIFYSFFVCFCFFQPLWAEKRVERGNDIVSVIRHGVRNDGSVIGSACHEELREDVVFSCRYL